MLKAVQDEQNVSESGDNDDEEAALDPPEGADNNVLNSSMRTFYSDGSRPAKRQRQLKPVINVVYEDIGGMDEVLQGMCERSLRSLRRDNRFDRHTQRSERSSNRSCFTPRYTNISGFARRPVFYCMALLDVV